MDQKHMLQLWNHYSLIPPQQGAGKSSDFASSRLLKEQSTVPLFAMVQVRQSHPEQLNCILLWKNKFIGIFIKKFLLSGGGEWKTRSNSY